MSRPRSESAGPAAAASSRRRRALTYDDLPKEIKGVIKDYVAFTNASLRAAVKEYFEDKAACERRHGKMNTWDVGRVTDMSRLFSVRHGGKPDFNEDIGAGATSLAACESSSRGAASTRVEGPGNRPGQVVGDDDGGNVFGRSRGFPL